MSQIPPDFERFVQNILQNQQVYVKLAFASIEELKFCTSYFFDQAVKHPNLSAKFAEAAAKLYFVSPQTAGKEEAANQRKKEDSLNLRKALIAESQLRVEEIQTDLENHADISLEKCLGVIKFFGELYNGESRRTQPANVFLSLIFVSVGFIFKGILKKHLDLLGSRKHECDKSNNAYYLLIETVKARVRSVHESDYTMTVKTMVEAIEEAENDPVRLSAPRNEVKPSTASPKKFEIAFPKLSESDEATSRQIQMSIKDSIQLKKTSFQRLLSEMKPDNSANIIKKIEDDHSFVFEDGMWLFCYEELIKNALNNHEVIGATLEICTKLPKCKIDVWRGNNKTEDYKKLVYRILSNQIVELFKETNPNRKIFAGFIKFIQKLLEQSLCSIDNISALVNVVISSKENNASFASDFLALLFTVVKKKFNTEMIKKLPEELRRKVIEIVNDGKKNVKDLEGYFFGSTVTEVLPSTAKVQNEAIR